MYENGCMYVCVYENGYVYVCDGNDGQQVWNSKINHLVIGIFVNVSTTEVESNVIESLLLAIIIDLECVEKKYTIL